MKLEQLVCPTCGGSIQINLNGQKTLFCPYCGNQFTIDTGDRVFTKNINIHKRYTNDAAVERELAIDRENEREHKEYKWTLKSLGVFMLVCMIIIGIMGVIEEFENQKSAAAGMIPVGQSSSDMEGKKYQAVVQQLESAGFTNITTIDLDDAGWINNKADTVDSVSIGGDTVFSSSDYFDPDAKIIVSYH